MIPARLGYDEENVEVFCDAAFFSCIQLAVGPEEGELVRT